MGVLTSENIVAFKIIKCHNTCIKFHGQTADTMTSLIKEHFVPVRNNRPEQRIQEDKLVAELTQKGMAPFDLGG